MNTPVSFEIAKLLKEKGFDEQNLTIYQDGEVLLLRSTISNSQFMTSRNYTAPTIAEVVMWLYEKHGIWIQVTVNTIWVGRKKEPEAKYNSEVVSQNRNLKVRSLITRKVRIEPYDSPTEAYESAIEYCLKNII